MWGLSLLVPILFYAAIMGYRDRILTEKSVDIQLSMIEMEEKFMADGSKGDVR